MIGRAKLEVETLQKANPQSAHESDGEDGMDELDDRLAGDPVWELFPSTVSSSAGGADRHRSAKRWLLVAGLIVLVWIPFPTVAVVAACLAVAAPDFLAGRRMLRFVPSKAGGTICSHFTYAWGALKAGFAATLLFYAEGFWLLLTPRTPGFPLPLAAALVLGFGGFTLSALLTASGLTRAYFSGMRVWIGEGVNRARTLLMGMLLVGFVPLVLGPLCVWLVRRSPPRASLEIEAMTSMLAMLGCLFVGPVLLLLVLDRIGKRIIADHPGKFGPKVSTVGKWTS